MAPGTQPVYDNVMQDSPIVRLCVEGMEMEGKGQVGEAAQRFAAAWNSSSNDFERCIAAHYVARHQKSPVETLRWNQESLRYADASDSASVREFYPSLYLNLGKSYEDLGKRDEARKFYELAARSAAVLPANGYGALVRSGIAGGLERVGHT